VRLDHLLSKEHLARSLRGACPEPFPGRMSRGGGLVERWLLSQLAGKASQYVLRGGRVAAAGRWLGTLLGPEGTGAVGLVFSWSVMARPGWGGFCRGAARILRTA
jgi:hypothetical protein